MIISDIKDDEIYSVAFDVKERRPGCVLIQAMHGCPSGIAHLFDTSKWILAPTPYMRPFKMPGYKLRKLAEIVNSGEIDELVSKE